MHATSHVRIAVPLILSSLASSLAAVPPRGPQGQQELQVEYEVLDNVEGPNVRLATFPVRPMAYDDQGGLWAVNHHDSRVRRFAPGNPAPERDHAVPRDPVAVAFWRPGSGPLAASGELLVVCRGTWAVVGLHPDTGEVVRFVQLRPDDVSPAQPNRMGKMAEPGDIVVDGEHERAFVSCTGADSILQIDLAADQVVQIFHWSDPLFGDDFLVKSPLFLSLIDGGEGGSHVLVTPLHSGNGSLAEANLATSRKVFLPADENWLDRLPDSDVFEIHPYVDGSDPGSVTRHEVSAGSVLFAHGTHPATGELWVLNTEHFNTGPGTQSEPALRGVFAQNRLTRLARTAGPDPTYTFAGATNLETAANGGTLVQPLGQPFALAFDASGYGFVAGLLTDNVAVLGTGGGAVLEWSIATPAGERAIPRGVLVREDGGDRLVDVYCWGDNAVRTYRVKDLGQPAASATLETVHPLGHDPAAELVREGRSLFYDATNSLHGNVSCATCHVEGGSDFLAWNLSNRPHELKGPMVTQTLVGLERLQPFHWRGERGFADFNPAFDALLGGTALSPAELEALGAFVFSLRNPANPNQHRERILDDSIHVQLDPSEHGAATSGQVRFSDPQFFTDGAHACSDCHAPPTGTINEFNAEQADQQRPRRGLLKAAPFHEVWRKQQKRLTLEDAKQDEHERAFLGSGFGHTGGRADLLDFVKGVVPSQLHDPGAKDIADFVGQWDQGLAPAVHYAYRLHDGNAALAGTAQELQGYLVVQAGLRYCDAAALGRVDAGGGTWMHRRWFLDTGLAPPVWISEDPSFGPRTLQDFLDGAAQGEIHVFLGLPVGMAERWAVDYDLDGLRNLDPAETDPYDLAVPGVTSPSPAFAAGELPEVTWTTARVARLRFETELPATAEIRVRESGAAQWPAEPDAASALGRRHAVMLTDLRPSSADATGNGNVVPETVQYDTWVRVRSADGATVLDHYGPSFATEPFTHPSGFPGSLPEAHDIAERQHWVTDLCLFSASPDETTSSCDELRDLGNGRVLLKVAIHVAAKRGDRGLLPDLPLSLPAAGRVVVGRVLVVRAGETLAIEDVGLVASPTSATLRADRFELVDPSGQVRVPVKGIPGHPSGQVGPFLISPLTDGNGRTEVRCIVESDTSTLPPAEVLLGDRLVFVVDAVVEAGSGVLAPEVVPVGGELVGRLTAEHPEFRFAQWSFPDTKEANAAVETIPFP